MTPQNDSAFQNAARVTLRAPAGRRLDEGLGAEPFETRLNPNDTPKRLRLSERRARRP
jgi:hypothetical protein